MSNINKFSVHNTGFYEDELRVQLFSVTAQEKSAIMGKETKDYYTLIYIESGKFDFFCNGNYNTLFKGDIFLSKPQEDFSIIASEKNVYIRFIQINIHPSLFFDANKKTKLLRPFDERDLYKNNIYKKSSFKEIEIYFSKINEFLEKNMPLEFYKSLVTLILFEICNVFDQKNNYFPAKFSHEYDLRIYSYIQSKSLTNIKIEDIAKEFFVSEWYINKVCNKFYGGNFSFMMKNCKMWAARGLMINKRDIDLGKIASLCGYSDYSGFFRVYKRFFHCSPKEDWEHYKKHGIFLEIN